MLMEELFARGIMTMGPSRTDPARQVGVFKPELIATLPGLRSAEMEKIRWIAGEWDHENAVPATRVSPAYSDIGVSRFSICENGNWICAVRPDGREIPHITFDPLSRQWIYLLFNGAYGILRSSEGWVGDRIAFTGLMTMIGIDCEWRLTLSRRGSDEFDLMRSRLRTAHGHTSTNGISGDRCLIRARCWLEWACRSLLRRGLQIAQASLEVLAHHAVHIHQDAHQLKHVDICAFHRPGDPG